MLATANVMGFVATTDGTRAKQFYKDVLGLEHVEDSEYAIVFRAHGTMLRVQKVRELAPHPFTQLGWHVTDIAKTVAGLAERGVAFERYAHVQQDAAGVWHTPDGTAKVAWFKDPDGNLLSLTQF